DLHAADAAIGKSGGPVALAFDAVHAELGTRLFPRPTLITLGLVNDFAGLDGQIFFLGTQPFSDLLKERITSGAGGVERGRRSAGAGGPSARARSTPH